MRIEEGRRRVVIEGVKPEIDAGRFPIKRVVGERVVVEADAFTDGHDAVSCVLLYRREGDTVWSEEEMQPIGNDRWRAAFEVLELGNYHYTVEAWADRFKSWARDFVKRVEAGQNVKIDLLIGAELVEQAVERALHEDAQSLRATARAFRDGGEEGIQQALSADLGELMHRYANREWASLYGRELTVMVDRELAEYGSWYEIYPRSWGPGTQPGTFRDLEQHLPYIESMGFDVLYLTPIHPIGTAFRKGKNNTVTAQPEDVGSTYAIGSPEGGHMDIHPQLGTFEDFRHLIGRAKEHGLEMAIDIAFNASPDHPYVKQHRSWFRERPDGTIQYSENPPKKYQDIYPFDFESEDWRGMWEELKNIVCFWIEQGVKIFRVDNPHTKAFPFWEWFIAEIRRDYPETIFLSEAFTRPKVMYQLAKLGFNQSYNYFPWRNTKWELTQFFTELTQTELREYLRPSLWPNTHDILTEYLQLGGRPAFMIRITLAATLGASYGIYGPAYELCVNEPLAIGKEEYLDSEKYEIKDWDLDQPNSLHDYIARLNQIRRENRALQRNHRLQFHQINNEQLLAYTKTTEQLDNIILTVVNLDPHHTQSGWVELPLEQLGIDPSQPFQVHDLLSDVRYLWNGAHNYVELNPHVVPAHVFLIRRRVRTEQDFDYYL